MSNFKIKFSELNRFDLKDLAGSLTPVFSANAMSGSSFTQLNINNLNTSSALQLPQPWTIPNAPLTCYAIKGGTGPANSTTTIWDSQTYGIGQGILNRLYLGVNGIDTSSSFLQVVVDGNINIGNISTTTGTVGLNQNGFPLDFAFAIGYGQTGIYNTQPYSNTWVQSGNHQISGYWSHPCQFSKRLQINLVNTSLTGCAFWLQPFIASLNPLQASLNPYKLYTTTFNWQTTTGGVEYPLVNITNASNGAYIRSIKMAIGGLSGNWWESRYRWYSGGSGMSGPIPSTPYQAGAFEISLPYQAGAVWLGGSSGTEDFFLSSNNFVENNYYMDDASLLYKSNLGNVGPTSSIIALRTFGVRTQDPMISSNGSNTLVLSWTSGDPIVNNFSGSVNTSGQVWYYA
jgi:hypothetical protein